MLGYGVIGFLVGVVPVALGLLWLPSLRRADPHWLAAFMAVTAGLLTFLGIEALGEAFERQAALPEPLAGTGLVLLGVALSYLTMIFLGTRFGRGDGSAGAGAAALALLVAVGIGVHNFGEGLAIGTSFAFGELAQGGAERRLLELGLVGKRLLEHGLLELGLLELGLLEHGLVRERILEHGFVAEGARHRQRGCRERG